MTRSCRRSLADDGPGDQAGPTGRQPRKASLSGPASVAEGGRSRLLDGPGKCVGGQISCDSRPGWRRYSLGTRKIRASVADVVLVPRECPGFHLLPRGADPGRPRSHSVKEGQPWPDDRRPARCQPGWGTCRSSSGPWPTASRPSSCRGATPPWWSATCITRSARWTSPRARPGWRTSSSTCCSRGPRGSPRGRSTAWRSSRPGSRTPRRGRTARITGSPSPPTAGSWR